MPIGNTGSYGLLTFGGTHTTGVEVSAVLRRLKALNLSGSGAYNDATYTGAVMGTDIVDSTPLDYVAKLTANASANYRTNITDAVSGFGRIDSELNSPRCKQTFAVYRLGDTIDLFDADRR